MKTSLILTTTALIAGGLAGMLPPSPVSAGYNAGVKEVSFLPEPCAPAGSALPPGYGGSDCGGAITTSNTLYVVQEQRPDGEYEFDHVVGTGSGGDVWLGFQLTAECRAGYRLYEAEINEELRDSEGGQAPSEVAKWSMDLEVDTSHMTIPDRHIDAEVPVERIEERLAYDQLDGHEGLVAFAEAMVAERVADGEHPDDVRTTAYEADTWLTYNVGVTCRGEGLLHLKRQMFDSAWAPLRIVFLPQGVEPGEGWRDAEVDLPDAPSKDQAHGGGLSIGTAITQATLVALPDPEDSCRILLSGTVTATAPTTIEYRFVNDLGLRSQWFNAEIDQTLGVLLDHHVDIEPAAADGGMGGFVIDEGETGPFDYAVEDTDRLQGWYQLEISTPHSFQSDVASFNFPPCEPSGETNPDLGRGGDEALVVPTIPGQRG